MTAVRLEDCGSYLVVHNRAEKRGALSPELYEAIALAQQQSHDPRIRAVILTGQGGFFCAGGDLNVLIERRKLPEEDRRARIDELHDLVRNIRHSTVPFIAAVEGGAAGAGLSLMMACDLIVAAAGAKFTAAYVKAGLVPDAGLTAHMARMLPRPLAMEMCLLGRSVTAERFAELGAVNHMCAEGSALSEARQYAQALAAGPRDAQRQIRLIVSEAYEASELAQLDAERDAMARAAGGMEAAEGIAAFLEKRAPRFQ